MPKLTYNVMTSMTESIPDGPRVTARCFTTNSIDVDFRFDCTEAFESLTKEQLQALEANSWKYCREAKYLAEYYMETRTSELFYAYNKADTGYEVTVDADSARAWLQHYRPKEYIHHFVLRFDIYSVHQDPTTLLKEAHVVAKTLIGSELGNLELVGSEPLLNEDGTD
jgi:hypothetical protein